MAFLKKLKRYGVVDITRNAWTYDRWSTLPNGPDSSNWTLVSQRPACKGGPLWRLFGLTGAEGITRDLALYTPNTPPESLKGKIVVFRTAPHPAPSVRQQLQRMVHAQRLRVPHFGGLSSSLFTQVSASETVSYDVWWQLRQTALVNRVLAQTQAAGGIVVFNMSYDRLAGLYTFPIPTPVQHSNPLCGPRSRATRSSCRMRRRQKGNPQAAGQGGTPPRPTSGSGICPGSVMELPKMRKSY